MTSERRAAGADIEATRLIPAPPAEVFEFLSDLGNHWLLTGRFVEVVELTRPGDGGPANGGRVRVRGPFGMRRTVTTRVTAARAPRLLIGIAELGEPGAGTRARVGWTLAGRLGQTRVLLSAEIQQVEPLDRLLLALGGRAWLRRSFGRTLERLAERFQAGSGLAPVRGAAVGLGLDDDAAGATLE